MSVPSSNQLRQALTALRCAVVQYRKALTRSVNDVGQWLTVHDQPLDIYGSFQPVPKRLYEQYGLDFQKSYYIFYSLERIFDLKRDISNDQLMYDGETFQCESNTGWFRSDSWDAVLCCKLEVPIIATNIWGFGVNNQNFTNGNFYVE